MILICQNSSDLLQRKQEYNFNLMKDIFQQLISMGQEMRSLQKGAFVAILFLVVIGLSFLLMKSPSSSYVTLYPGREMSASEVGAIRSSLEHAAFSFQKDKEGRLCVLSEQVDQARVSLERAGILKSGQGKGFELFDTNTWIKGEKELQVLEMRALKGQLEKDLMAFEKIKNASVILDIPPPKTFNGTKYPAKASVILTLMPKAHLSSSELRAITNHLTGAVRGLEPSMIAVSDTTGKLYKVIDPTSKERSIDQLILFEEKLEEKIATLLTHLVGEENFHITTQVCLEKESEKPRELVVAVVINKETQREASFREEIEQQLATLVKGCGPESAVSVVFLPFDKEETFEVRESHEGKTMGILFTLSFLIAVCIALFPFFRKFKRKKGEEETLFRLMTRIDLTKLGASLQDEDPRKIALMLSYLQPSRAEQLIAALNTTLQDEVLFHLSEMEREEP